jgi:siroheme synthase
MVEKAIEGKTVVRLKGGDPIENNTNKLISMTINDHRGTSGLDIERI